MIEVSINEPHRNSAWRKTWDISDKAAPALLSEVDLRYRCFAVGVTLRSGSTVIIGPDRMTPLFDFLATLVRVIQRIKAGEAASIGFTEAADRIGISVAGETITLDAGGDCALAEVSTLEFIAALEAALARGRSLLFSAQADLVANPFVRVLFE